MGELLGAFGFAKNWPGRRVTGQSIVKLTLAIEEKEDIVTTSKNPQAVMIIFKGDYFNKGSNYS